MQVDSQPSSKVPRTNNEASSEDVKTTPSSPQPSKENSRSASGTLSADPSRKGFKIIAFAIIVLAYTFLQTSGWKKARKLPTTYAVCSRAGNIYTVDPEIPKAECMVVHKGRITDVGSIGMQLLILLKLQVLSWFNLWPYRQCSCKMGRQR